MSSVHTTEITSTRKRAPLAGSGVIVQRTPIGQSRMSMSMGGPGGGGVIRRSNITTYQSMPLQRAQGEATKVSQETVQNVASVRGKEKKEMTGLNERLAGYIEKQRFLDAQNKALVDECEKLRKLKGYTQDRVKEECQDEIDELRRTVDQLKKEIAPLEAARISLEDKNEAQEEEIKELRRQRDDLKNEIDKLNNMCGEYEGELAALRRQMETYGRENDMLKSDLERLRADNCRVRDDFDTAVNKQICAEGERDALLAELQFEKDCAKAEIDELRELLANLKATQPNIEKMWKSEFKDCIAEITNEYQNQLDNMTMECQRRYEEQVQALKSAQVRDGGDGGIVKAENKTLKSQMSDTKHKLGALQGENDLLRAQLAELQRKYDDECEDCEKEKMELRGRITELECEIQDVLANLNNIRDANLTLEMEIACYRKLLEGEETKMQRALEDQGQLQSKAGAQLADIISGGQMQQSSTMSETSGLVRIARSSKVNCVIKEIEGSGEYIALANNSRKPFDLGNWILERTSPKGNASYKFPDNFKLGPEKTIKIYCKKEEKEASADDIIAPGSTCYFWGKGNGKVTLSDSTGSEKCNATVTFQTQT